MGARPIRPWQLQMLAVKLQYRGDDATGICLQNKKGDLFVYKNNEPAWRFCKDKKFDEFLGDVLDDSIMIALVHTRKWTQGTPSKNDNNHPIYKGQGAIVHNGVVQNEDTLFNANNRLVRSCETDSDIFRAILDDYGRIDAGIFDAMSHVLGTAAVAALHPASPGKLLLLRDSNPLVLGATTDMLMFASDKTALHAALKPWVRLHNIPMQVHAPDLSFIPVDNETGLIIGPKGLETHGVFKCNGQHRQGNLKYALNTTYHERRERADREAAESEPKKTASTVTPGSEVSRVSLVHGMPDWVICPGSSCGHHVRLTDEDKKLESLSKLICGECKTNLAGAIATIRSN